MSLEISYYYLVTAYVNLTSLHLGDFGIKKASHSIYRTL